ncbi:MAG: Trk system potassium transporter TrkA [Spirochaetes bacterium]|nr:Trk system potassium transporter TrkA [Spirochaetota bacterium]
MHIVIIGAGSIGTHIASQLISENKDVVLIEKNPERVKYVSARLDCMVLNEDGTNIKTLKRAGIDKADFFISVTNSDEVNMISSGVVSSEFNVPYKIARVRSLDYSRSKVLGKSFLGINYIVNPGIETAHDIVETVAYGAISDVFTFEKSGIIMRNLFVDQWSSFKGKNLREIRQTIDEDFLIAAIIRRSTVIIPSGTDEVLENDTIYLASSPQNLERVFAKAGRPTGAIRNAVIVGGGTIGSLVAADLLDRNIRLKIIDNDYERCKLVTGRLSEALVIHSDISDEGIFEEERLYENDLMIAVTGSQEINILSAAYAKSIGVKRTIAIVTKQSYLSISSELGIDSTISPKTSTADAILKFVRGRNIQSVHSIFDGRAEVIEITVGDSSEATGVPLKDLEMPANSLILSVNRDGDDFVPGGDFEIRGGGRCPGHHQEEVGADHRGALHEGAMNGLMVIRIISFVMAVIGFFMIVPLCIAIGYREVSSIKAFGITIAVIAAGPGLLLFLLRGSKAKMLSTRDGYLFVAFSWVFASIAGSLPFWLSGAIPVYTDAFFETISGFTTTGASILTNIEGLPRSMLFWRSLTHWLGGMGIVVLTVAILPILGIGGMQLIQAEAPGPTVDKISPRITETAKKLWAIYIGFTVAETLLLLLGGMDLFDALTHTFGTLATGGFSTRNASVGAYNSPLIEGVITVFMILAGVNFSLHYRLLTGSGGSLLRDTEFRTYIVVFLGATAILTVSLAGRVYGHPGEALRHASFQCASILTTTGFATADFERWPLVAQAVLFILMFFGGCSGSTGGGIKIIRLVTLFKQALNEMKYLLHPRGIFTLRISGSPIKKDVAYAISGFFFLYIFIILAVTLVVALSGHDILTSLSAALATLGNIGPGFGLVGPTENYSIFSGFVKWLLCFAMLIGRLELYTVLVLFTPTFWRR